MAVKPYTEKPYSEKPYAEKPSSGKPCPDKPAGALVQQQRLPEYRVWIWMVRGGIVLAALLAGALVAALTGAMTAAVIGLVAGVLLQEAVCSVVPALRPHTRPRFLPLARYRTIRWWYACVSAWLVVWSVVGMGAAMLFSDQIDAARLMYWGGPWVAAFLVCSVLGSMVQGWNCPRCDRSFDFKGAFVPYPHVCRHCGLTVDQEA